MDRMTPSTTPAFGHPSCSRRGVTFQFIRSQAADGQDRAFGTLHQVPLSWAIPRNSQMAKGKIILERVFRIEQAKLAGDVHGHRPSGTLSIGQSNVAGDSRDVRVEWNHKASGSE